MVAEGRLGGVLGKIRAALQHAIQDSPDEGCAIDGLVAALSNGSRQIVQVLYLSLEQHDRHFCPGFLVDMRTTWAPRTGFRGGRWRHTPLHNAEILAALLPAQTHPFEAHAL